MNKDLEETISRYTKRYYKFGYSPKTLGWEKGRQGIRFNHLIKPFDLSNKHILDIGCGFGDLNKVLAEKTSDYTYLGIDIVEELINEGKKRYGGENIDFIHGDFLNFNFQNKFDIAVASGIFNFKYDNIDNYDIIERTIKKALDITKIGIAFDFLSDKVDYKLKHTFHSKPEKILSIAYKYSRNLLLRNDYMPFEFTLYIFKDDSFDQNAVFNRKNKKI